MNRQQRRALGKRTPNSVHLIGGPMDGWVVTPDAPALRADWHTTWPPRLYTAWEPGRYTVAGREAHWT